jgi:DNA repair protein SbcC/Rad50
MLPDLNSRSQKLDEYKRQLMDALAKAETQYRETETAYSPNEHLAVKEVVHVSGNRLSAIDAEMGMRQERLIAVQNQIHDLEPLGERLTACDVERKQAQEVGEFISFTRNSIREAGPLVTRTLVQRISEGASSYYKDILDDHTQGLSWDEEYGINISQYGQDREFGQLSGGEKTIAALAVRLALLRHLSEVRMVFLDEPTAYLDEQRRINLADQISRIRGFDQVFVISHDSAFETDANHVINITKDSAGSHAEVKR